jgi:hypothetical protein
VAPADNKSDPKKPVSKGGLVVIHRAKHDKNIADEPQMKELKRMIRHGDLDPERVTDHLEKIKKVGAE